MVVPYGSGPNRWDHQTKCLHLGQETPRNRLGLSGRQTDTRSTDHQSVGLSAPRLAPWPVRKHFKVMASVRCVCWPKRRLNWRMLSMFHTPMSGVFSKRRTQTLPERCWCIGQITRRSIAYMGLILWWYAHSYEPLYPLVYLDERQRSFLTAGRHPSLVATQQTGILP